MNLIAGLLANWKTTSMGITMIVGAGVHLYFAVKNGTVDEATLKNDLLAVVAGAGLMVAADSKKAEGERLEGKAEGERLKAEVGEGEGKAEVGTTKTETTLINNEDIKKTDGLPTSTDGGALPGGSAGAGSA